MKNNNLDKNNFFYLKFLKEIKSTKNVESRLKRIQDLIQLIFDYHAGRFYDGELENYCLDIGGTITVENNSTNIPNWHLSASRSKTLHIVTTLYETGGHSRVLIQWASTLSSNDFIIITDQLEEISSYQKAYLNDNNIPFLCLNTSLPILHRSLQVRKIAQGMNRIILHQHPHDVIPIIALSHEVHCPVAFFNHAHFNFSFGASVTDLFINTLDFFKELSITRREAEDVELLIAPIKINTTNKRNLSKSRAREELDLPDNVFVALTMGSRHYYTPTPEYNFFSTSSKLLDNIPNLYIIFIGVDKEFEHLPVNILEHPRARIEGVVADPIDFILASDLFLESFPFPSLGSLTQSVAAGNLFPIPCYRKNNNILRMDYSPKFSFEYIPNDEADYITYVKDVLNMKDLSEKGEEIGGRLLALQAKFKENILSIYKNLDSREHTVKKLPVTECCYSENDVLLANLRDYSLCLLLFQNLPFFKALTASINALSKNYISIPEFFERVAKEFKKLVLFRPGYRYSKFSNNK